MQLPKEFAIEELVESVQLEPTEATEGYTYFGVAKGERTIITDIRLADGKYLSHEDKFREAERLGYECVPLLHMGPIEDAKQLWMLLFYPSSLGDAQMDGLLITPCHPKLEQKQFVLRMQDRGRVATVPETQASELDLSMRQQDQLRKIL